MRASLIAWAMAALAIAALLGSFLLLLVPRERPLGVETRGNSPLVGVVVFSLVGALIIRFRRAAGIERQQLKWVAYGGGIATVAFVVGSFGYVVPEIGPVGNAVAAVGVLLIPITAAFAILRYRLYDIDVVIERTLVYGALSAALAATYWVLVLNSPATGQRYPRPAI